MLYKLYNVDYQIKLDLFEVENFIPVFIKF